LGYEKIKAPPELFAMILDFYNKNKHMAESEWKQINTYHNMWEAPTTIVHLNQRKNPGGGGNLQSKIWASAGPLMEQWTGQELAPVSLYGIRLYHNGSILAPHVDRMPLVISAISKFTRKGRKRHVRLAISVFLMRSIFESTQSTWTKMLTNHGK
jgi:prolyl 4-hydroxylase